MAILEQPLRSLTALSLAPVQLLVIPPKDFCSYKFCN
ncbi:MAG: hypothetical protein EWV81_12565 [Microcystis aeruginosa Ma_SC_T_19800800_S464]|uniref:Uncharacterized protein n=1 Tax=Microcystis aeruginosa Ma_SC_T_19800800_S464 TaxID=2486257 RepID=A0A552DSN5_MICAE|nr:MAG: hypothetical protein EWV81_12565 [Microcystis aeruginosa Ma_SC_T_19800800_S464]